MTEKELQQKFDNFAWNVYALRRNANLTQQELADKVGTSNCVISHLECRRRMAMCSTALLVADALGVTVNDLFDKRFELQYPLKKLMGGKPWRER